MAVENLKYPGSLHNHTHFSNLRIRDALCRENELIDYAIELGHDTVAITDHETVASWIKVEEYYSKIKKKNPDFKVIRGNEIYLCRNGLNASNFNREYDKYYHFILLAKDLIGAKQIFELSTRAWNRSYMARGMRRVPTYYQDLFDVIGSNPGHVIGSTACLGGAIPTQILRGTPEDKIFGWLNQMIELFGKENFYLEMQPSKNKEQITVNKKLLEYSQKLGIEYIITTDTHYLKKEDRKVHKAYLNAQDGDREVDSFYTTTYLMSDEELRAFFEYFSEEELQKAYQTIVKIKSSCEDFSILKPLKIPNLIWRDHTLSKGIAEYGFYFDKMPTLKKFLTSPHKSDRELVYATILGIEKHEDLQNDAAYKELEQNLQKTWISSEVNKARWSAYYLNLQKNIDEFWNAGSIVGPARGSGGGFLLLYCLDIIQMNKLREDTEMFDWRFLNPERESVLDIDQDIEGRLRGQVLSHLRQVYGQDRVSNVSTWRTEQTKAAILTGARGLELNPDIGQYIASLIPADRGKLRTLSQCMYGDEENNWPPIKQFVYEMTENYPDLWEVASKIEGLICGSGIHAGGIIFVDEPFTESTALMRAPDGTICTQFDLHDCEKASLIKIDALSVEAMDKIHICLDLLCEYGYIERKATLRETYENAIGVYNLERNDPKMWEMVWEHKITSLFQMEQQSGIQGIALTKPKSVGELAILNSIIRLMASEPGAEQPLNIWARYRKDLSGWFREMRKYGLSEEEITWLSHNSAIHNGLCESQESMMTLVQDERLGGNTLNFADKCRKAIAKKQGKLFEECEKFFFQNAEEKHCDMKLVHYVWDVLFKVQRGYSFNASHTHAYSLVALQEMNLAYKYPVIFWNCACLISDAGSSDEEPNEDESYDYLTFESSYSNEMEEFTEEDEEDITDTYEEDEDCDGFPATIAVMANGKKKKKVKTTNYGKVATAIGKMRQDGILVCPPDINKSTFTFSPDPKDNLIRYGISGITRIGPDIISQIISNRPYTSLTDFLSKVKLNKPQMVNLIKSGAFDEFGNRIELMERYILSVADQKKRLTLQNMQMLIAKNLIPEELSFEVKVFNFNKYLKKAKSGIYYEIDDIAYPFYEQNFDLDKIFLVNDKRVIEQTIWDKIYKKAMDPVREYLKIDTTTKLNELNKRLFQEEWDKYCGGTISKWEMDSVSYYSHPHELAAVDENIYNIVNFFELPEEPVAEKTLWIKGKEVPIYKLSRIAGTILDKDKNKSTITVLTTHGVVVVKIYKAQFAKYDRQLSERLADGTKHIIEKSWFKRGNKVLLMGIRRGQNFIPKKYKSTPGSVISLITEINGKEIKYKTEREEIE